MKRISLPLVVSQVNQEWLDEAQRENFLKLSSFHTSDKQNMERKNSAHWSEASAPTEKRIEKYGQKEVLIKI